MIRRSFMGPVLLISGGLMIGILLWRPYHDGILRYGFIAALLAVWTGLLCMAWKRHGWRITVLLLPLLLAQPFLLPGRELDQRRLLDRYLTTMRSFEGTRYVWGGEGRTGIDCSGLPRAGLRSALAEQALQGNGRAARLWLEQWWFDTSAKAMAENYRGFTRDEGIAGDMRQLDLAKIQPGDLAVTMDRRHVMIYMGSGEWIQADPGPGRVFTARAGSEQSSYLSSEVSLCRWTVLADQG